MAAMSSKLCRSVPYSTSATAGAGRGAARGDASGAAAHGSLARKRAGKMRGRCGLWKATERKHGGRAGEAAGALLPWLQRRVCVALHTGPHREFLVKLRAAPLAERESWPHAAHDTLHAASGGGGGGERERGSGDGDGAVRRALHGADDAELLERNAAR